MGTNGTGGAELRVSWVDAAKGICIIFVVMMHSTLGVGIAMGGTGFMHDVVAFARPYPHARLLPDIRPLPGARQSTGRGCAT